MEPSAPAILPAFAGRRLEIGPDEIGLACRYKAGPNIRSTDEGGHADALLPRGVPVGYYARTRRDRRLALIAPGMVKRGEALRAHRCPTTFALIRVGEARAAAFARAWEEIEADPPLFLAIGGNCAQVIFGALVRAGAMPRRLIAPGSPDALFRALQRAHPEARIATGFASFLADGAGGYRVELAA
ncbi:hypothetical protein [Rubritepida flocculans]|uniref:hypothetical protein n=1 Tax=Rubritepida flocculans TaxID=182403 RepID=UPI000416D5AB|nr:hypothetical protein [Rubritepida flocculans]